MPELSWLIALILLFLLIISALCGILYMAFPLILIFTVFQLIAVFIYIYHVIYRTEKENIRKSGIKITKIFILYLRAYYCELRFKTMPFILICLTIIVSIFFLNTFAGITFIISAAIIFFLVDSYRRKKKNTYVSRMKEEKIKSLVENYSTEGRELLIIQIKFFELLKRKFLIKKDEIIPNKPDEHKERKSCPLCKEKDFISFITCSYGWNYVICSGCDFVYMENVNIKDTELEEIYTEDYSKNYLIPVTVEANKKMAGLYLGDEKPGRLLEIGCSVGTFLKEAEMMGFEVEECEIEPWAVEEAKKLGLKVKAGPFEELEYDESSFDYIVMFHVLEHFLDPLSALKKIFKMLKPGGYLFNCMPDITTCTGKDWFEFKKCCEHLNFFTLKTFEYFSGDTGYKILTTGKKETVFWVLLQKINKTCPEVPNSNLSCQD